MSKPSDRAICRTAAIEAMKPFGREAVQEVAARLDTLPYTGDLNAYVQAVIGVTTSVGEAVVADLRKKGDDFRRQADEHERKHAEFLRQMKILDSIKDDDRIH